MKVNELSLLIIDGDKDMRQLLTAFVSDRYRSVTAAAPKEVSSLKVLLNATPCFEDPKVPLMKER